MTIRHFKIKKIERRIIKLKRRAQDQYGRARERWPAFIIDRYEELKAKARDLRGVKAA